MRFALFLSILLCGCTNRTIYVPDGSAVRLRESVEAAVWVFDKSGEMRPGYMEIPEGWYCLPDPGDDDGQ